MINIKKILIVVLLSLSMSLFLINCGGSGDGSGGIPYEGSESQVVINDSNAEAIATSVYENSTSMRSIGETGGIFSAVSTNGNGKITKPYGVALAHFVREFLQQADMSSVSGDNVGAAISESGSMTGECGGSVTFSGTANEATGSYKITATFSSYCSDGDGSSSGIIADGTIKMVGSLQPEPFQMHTNLTLSNFEVTQLDTGVSETASGTMTMSMNNYNAHIGMSVVMRENSSGKTYKVVDLAFNMYGIYSTSPTLLIGGRFYDPDYGYVDISTIDAFRLDVSGNTPTSGTIIIIGASNTKARLIVESSIQYQVQADTDGNGTFEYDAGTLYW